MQKLWTKEELRNEFERQKSNLINLNYHKESAIPEEDFLYQLDLLKEKVEKIGSNSDIPFIIVISEKLITAEKIMEKIKYKNTTAYVDMNPEIPENFSNIKELKAPYSDIYLITDIDTGKSDTMNVTPFDALKLILDNQREPLNISEGIAILTHYSDILKTHNCFSLLGSRKGDKKVPALWISYKRPRLGWCWENNPHTWLGSASCKERIEFNYLINSLRNPFPSN